MKYINKIGVVLSAGFVLAAASCSDFSDYNEVSVGDSSTGSLTLWENISQNTQLKDFAALVKQSGYDSVLNTPRSLTVWAPLDGTFIRAQFDTLSKEQLLTQFVKAHIAEYSHTATGKVEERVHMLNEKSFDFVGDGSYTFANRTISTANLPSNNGVMHLMNGAAQFYHNLYEYISVGSGLDSLRNHFLNYEQKYLDQSASVKGPMVDGVQTYINEVWVTYNTLVNQLGARIANEDSSYTFVMPTNEAFMEMYNRVKPYYNFITTTKVHDVASYSSASGTDTKTTTVNASYMTDSLVRRQIVRNLIYSNNDTYNQWIVGKGTSTDTIRSTTRNKFSNPQAILNDHLVGEPVMASNGYARIVDSLAFYPWETFCPELSFSPRRNMVKLFPAASSMSPVTVRNADGSPLTWLLGPETLETEYRYGAISAGGDRVKPDFFLSLPDAMSTTYNFYVVFMPTLWIDSIQGQHPNGLVYNESRPCWLNFQLQYCDAKGNTQVYNFSKAYADSLLSGGTLPKVPASVSSTTAFSNDPQKVDTVFIGQFTFPVNYNGLGQDFYPSLHITSPISVFNNTQLSTYSRDVHIAAILMRPVELEEFEAKNK